MRFATEGGARISYAQRTCVFNHLYIRAFGRVNRIPHQCALSEYIPPNAETVLPLDNRRFGHIRELGTRVILPSNLL